MKKVTNSSGEEIGEIQIDKNQITICHKTKPPLIISDIKLINSILRKDETVFPILFNDYELLIAEIAALYDIHYATARKHLAAQNLNTSSHAGRRNSSYGKTFSEEHRKHIGEKSKGRKITPYIRTPEIRKKISKGLKTYYANNEVSDETRKKLSQAWKDGAYDHSPMGRGYNGWMFSIKNQKDIYFRSFLELYYFLQLEKDSSVQVYQVEPFKINLSNGHTYTPDVLINNAFLIELKPFNHLNWANQTLWEEKIKAAKKYCEEHKLIFKVVYDLDINFESRDFKRWFINHKNELIQYNIRLNRDIVWS